MRKIIFIDMDGVIVDLGKNIENWFELHPNLINKYKNYPDHIPGIFRDPPPIENAIESIKKLLKSGKYEMFIATSSPWGNPDALTDKRYWIEKHFGNIFHKKLITTHHKNLLLGDYLIDDRKKNGANEFKGTLIDFGWDFEKKEYNNYKNWSEVLDFFL